MGRRHSTRQRHDHECMVDCCDAIAVRNHKIWQDLLDILMTNTGRMIFIAQRGLDQPRAGEDRNEFHTRPSYWLGHVAKQPINFWPGGASFSADNKFVNARRHGHQPAERQFQPHRTRSGPILIYRSYRGNRMIDEVSSWLDEPTIVSPYTHDDPAAEIIPPEEIVCMPALQIIIGKKAIQSFINSSPAQHEVEVLKTLYVSLE